MRSSVLTLVLSLSVTSIAACGGSQSASNTELEARMSPSQQIDRATDRAQADQHTNPKSACFEGLVQTAGPLGGPLDRVHVQVRHEQTDLAEAATDFAGRFHACIPREKASVGERLLVPAHGYRDKTIHVTLTFSREGFASKAMGLDWDTADPPKKLEVMLEKQ